MSHVLVETGGRRGAMWTLALTCGAFLGAGTALASLGPCLPWLAQRTGQELANLSWLFTALSAGVVLMQMGLGSASARLGLRGVLGLGMALMGCAMLGTTLAPNMAALVITVGLAGVGFGGVLGAGNILVARTFAQRSATALNGVNIFFGLGAILGPAIVGQAEARLGLPQVAMWIGSGLSVALAPLVLRLAAAAPPLAHERAGASGARARAWPVWTLGLLLLIYTGTEVGFSGWVTVYMQRSTGMALAEATLVASGFWLALSGGRVLGAALGMRLAPGSLLLVALAGLVAGVVLLGLSVGAPVRSLAGAMLFGLACGPVFPTLVALITTLSHGNSGLAGMALGLGNSGGLVLPALIGLLLTSYGPPVMLGVMLACTLTMLGLGRVALRPQR